MATNEAANGRLALTADDILGAEDLPTEWVPTPEWAPEGDYVVYPTHGVGKVTGVEKKEIAGQELTLFVIQFEKERMTLRVPVSKVKVAGLRKLSRDVQLPPMLLLLARLPVRPPRLSLLRWCLPDDGPPQPPRLPLRTRALAETGAAFLVGESGAASP